MDDFDFIILTVWFVMLMLTLFWIDYRLQQMIQELRRIRREVVFGNIDEREK